MAEPAVGAGRTSKDRAMGTRTGGPGCCDSGDQQSPHACAFAAGEGLWSCGEAGGLGSLVWPGRDLGAAGGDQTCGTTSDSFPFCRQEIKAQRGELVHLGSHGYAKQKKPATKGQTLYDSTRPRFLEYPHYRGEGDGDTKDEGGGRSSRRLTERGQSGSCAEIRKFWSWKGRWCPTL